jgi:hypothetical protein
MGPGNPNGQYQGALIARVEDEFSRFRYEEGLRLEVFPRDQKATGCLAALAKADNR